MSYTGNVGVGGAADTRELPGLTITKVAVGPMDNNAYLLRCTQTGELALIDAANEADTLLGLIGDAPAGHDHHDAPALGPSRRAARGAAGHRRRDGRPSRRRARPADPGHPAGQHGDTIDVGNARLSVIHLRGHTPGSIALLLRRRRRAGRPSRTCSPATRCSPAARATPSMTRSGSAA